MRGLVALHASSDGLSVLNSCQDAKLQRDPGKVDDIRSSASDRPGLTCLQAHQTETLSVTVLHGINDVSLHVMRAHLQEPLRASPIRASSPVEEGHGYDMPAARSQQLLARQHLPRHRQRVGHEVVRSIHLKSYALSCTEKVPAR